MTQREMTEYSLGETLDSLMNLDPRGYGVCRILYSKSRRIAGEPVSLHAAKLMLGKIGKGDRVTLITGFVLRPYGCAETDGIIGTMFLARLIRETLGAEPAIVCQEENVPAVLGLSRLLGLHAYPSAGMLGMPHSVAYFPFTKDALSAGERAEELLRGLDPALVISVEAPGANALGVYHNAVGEDVTALEAKSDAFFRAAKAGGVPTLAVGDLGNEIGMGTLGDTLKDYVPYAGEGECACGCGGGIAADTCADAVLTATVSDWGCYALCAMAAYLTGDMSAMHGAELQERAMRRAADCGMIDMYGQTIPAIDGIGVDLTCAIVTSMRECARYSLELEERCAGWFEKTAEKGFFESLAKAGKGDCDE